MSKLKRIAKEQAHKTRKAKARAKVVAKRDAARKKVKVLENRHDVTGGRIRNGPLMKRRGRKKG